MQNGLRLMLLPTGTAIGIGLITAAAIAAGSCAGQEDAKKATLEKWIDYAAAAQVPGIIDCAEKEAKEYGRFWTTMRTGPDGAHLGLDKEDDPLSSEEIELTAIRYCWINHMTEAERAGKTAIMEANREGALKRLQKRREMLQN